MNEQMCKSCGFLGPHTQDGHCIRCNTSISEVLRAQGRVEPEVRAARDNWANRGSYHCGTCMFWVVKLDRLGRCRRHAPTLAGWPVTYRSDWCGDHKLDAAKVVT